MSPQGSNAGGDRPIEELRGLSVEPSAGFGPRLRRRIERRETSNNLLVAVWHVPFAVLLAFLEMTFSLFRPGPSDRGGSQ